MYHAARSVVFLNHKGDDFEDHDKVANNLPRDFPGIERWQNDFKEARLKRNEADYEPYPTKDSAFSSVSIALLNSSEEFSVVCSSYLRGQGCDL